MHAQRSVLIDLINGAIRKVMSRNIGSDDLFFALNINSVT